MHMRWPVSDVNWPLLFGIAWIISPPSSLMNPFASLLASLLALLLASLLASLFASLLIVGRLTTLPRTRNLFDWSPCHLVTCH